MAASLQDQVFITLESRDWWEVVHTILFMFRNNFLHLKHIGMLNRTNEIDLFSLHYVYMPRINYALEQFVSTFNNHGISTEHNRSPHQLWISGILQHHSSSYAGVRGVVNNTMPEDLTMYGDDPTAPVPENDLTGVDVATINVDFPAHIFMVLEETFNPMEQDDNQGMNIYLQVRQFLLLYWQSTNM